MKDGYRKARGNADQKRAIKAADVAIFVRRYGRKAQKGQDPNDRQYDRRLERTLKTLPPDQLDQLIRDDED